MAEDPVRECFVCLEGGGVLLTGLCACTTRAVHLKCQRKMLKKSPKRRESLAELLSCPVCKVPYKNVHLASRRHLTRDGMIVGLSALISSLCLTAGAWELWLYEHEETKWIWAQIMGGVFLTLGAFGAVFGGIAYYKRRSPKLFAKVTCVRLSKTIR